MATIEMTTADQLMRQVAKIEPMIRAHAAEAEQHCRLSPKVAAALREIGCYRMFRPTACGGLGFNPVSGHRVIEELSRIDSAAGWNVAIANACESFGGWLDEADAQTVYGSPDAVLAGSFFPPRRAIAVDGGYSVTGRCPFNSNVHNATWLIGLAHVFDGETQRTNDDGSPATIITFLPATDVTIIENWDTLGMRGTGSHDVEVKDLFVPNKYAPNFVPIDTPNPAYDTPFHRMATWASIACNAVPALGIAQAAIDDLVALGRKVPAYTERALRNRHVVQRNLAKASGKVEAARAFAHTVLNEAWQNARNGIITDLQTRARSQLAAVHMLTASAEAVDLVHSCVGASGIRCDQRFQRYFRDVHVITQHAYVCEDRLESVGQIMFGMEPEWGFFAFA